MRLLLCLGSFLLPAALFASQHSYLSTSEADEIERYTVKSVKYLLMAENNLRTQHYADAVVNLRQSREFSQQAFEVLPVVRIKDRMEVSRESFLAGRDTLFKKSLQPLFRSLEACSYFKDGQREQIQKEMELASTFIGKNDRDQGVESINKAMAFLTYGREDLEVINLLRLSNRTLEQLKAREFDAARNILRSSKFFYTENKQSSLQSSL